MPIIPLDDIPLNAKKVVFREMIEKDLRYALDNNIVKFEFIGEYNYTNLANYAKEIYRCYVFGDFFDKKLKELAKKYNVDNPSRLKLSLYKYDKYRNSSFKTYKIYDNTKIRVFGEFNLDIIEDMYEQMENDVARKLQS